VHQKPTRKGCDIFFVHALCVITYSATSQQVPWLGDVDGDPPRLVAREEVRRRATV